MTNKPSILYVIALVSPIHHWEVKYIGLTSDPDKLKQLHLSKWAYSKGNTGKNEWVKTLIALKLRPGIAVLAKTTRKGGPGARRSWMKLYRRWGATLFNVDKSEKCRAASLALWQTQDFWLKVKTGIAKKSQERWDKWQLELQNIPILKEPVGTT
jgi:hypothetical protein